MKSVLVAMSGGVDSSTSAYLLKKSGYKVYGVNFQFLSNNWSEKKLLGKQARNKERVKRICDYLGIPFITADYSQKFYREVVKYFVNTYAKGFTPNPCVICNPKVKFHSLLEISENREIDYISTGHYARVENEKEKENELKILKKGADTKKEQSYFLYRLNQNIVSKLILPLGEFTKDKTKKLAKEYFSDLGDRLFPEESQEVCFISNNYRDFLIKIAPELLKPGNIVDLDGNVLGKHRGIAFYTVGQRRGLGISANEPLYVLKIDAPKNKLIVGRKKNLQRNIIKVTDLNFIKDNPPSRSFKCDVKVRYRMKPVPAEVTIDEDNESGKNSTGSFDAAVVNFLKPCPFPAPGQSAVFYNNETLMGGGIIKEWL